MRILSHLSLVARVAHDKPLWHSPPACVCLCLALILAQVFYATPACFFFFGNSFIEIIHIQYGLPILNVQFNVFCIFI